MTREWSTKVAFTGFLVLSLFACTSCIVIDASDGDGVRYEREVELSATIDASTTDGSIHTSLPITVEGKVGKSLTGRIGGGEGKIYLRVHEGSITIR